MVLEDTDRWCCVESDQEKNSGLLSFRSIVDII